MKNFFRKAHKWVGLFIALLLILFSLSGIILNHRDFFSSTDISRNCLPTEYRYSNWNNAAVKSTLNIGADSVLVYGNIGVWLTNSDFNRHRDFNHGFGNGIDNRKIFRIIKANKQLLAGTLFGLYKRDKHAAGWQKIALPVHEQNVVDLLKKGDSIFVLTRSNLLLTTDAVHFKVVPLPEPEHYDHRVSLFKTLWVIHSGDIYGKAGKLIVDLVAVVFIFLSIGGAILFFSKKNIRKHKANVPKREKHKALYKWNFKWHNKIGWFTGILLFITVLTGTFLRPPLLIAIAESRVGKIPHTELDTPNPWFDILRRIIYIPEKKMYIVSTSDGFYSFDKDFTHPAVLFDKQPPASVMGVNVLEYEGKNKLLIGSFSGLFLWNFQSGEVFDVIKKTPYVAPVRKGPPVGDFKISGFSTDFHQQPIAFEYGKGAFNINEGKPLPSMPDAIIKHSPISLWNLALEVHTTRIYSALMGNFYILLIPLGGILILLTIISGVVLKLRQKK